MNHWQNKSIKDIEGEVWKAIPGYEGLYMVSDFGRLKRLSYCEANDRKTFHPEKILSQTPRRGYLCVAIFDKNGHSYQTKAHRLIAMAFIPNPFNKPYINHKDFNRQNNSPLNLEWVTPQENMDHLKINGRSLKGVLNPAAILKQEDVIKIKQDRKKMKVKDIAAKFGVSIPTIEKILYRGTWKHLI